MFAFPENRALCEIMWKNSVVPGRPQMTISGMRIELHVGYLRLQTQV